ncbi:beta-sarcoglycan-like [Diadema antillarum]|uniref:beta-sarcoglycan-like n=1 Tax=Diadema antillarum TaxID=105358 RepID=UPI003A850DC1
MDENNATFRRSTSRLSMLDKSLERRRVNKEHNSNFRAGYVAVHEEHLHKTGLRGRKRFLAYLLLFLIYVVVIANLVLTVLIVLALRIDQTGSDVLEFVDGGDIQYKEDVQAEKVLTDLGEFGGYRGQDLEINGDGQPVVLQQMMGGATVEISGESTTMRAQEGLQIINPMTGGSILHTVNDSGIATPTGMKQLASSRVVASKLSPGPGETLSMEAEEGITIQGNEGLSLSAKEIDLSGENVTLNALDLMSLEVGPSGGINVNTTLLPKKSTGRLSGSVTGYTLCVCSDTGKVVRVRAPPGMSHPCGKLSSNPCAE